MTPEALFGLANMTAMIGWILLLALPRWIVTRKVIRSGIFPILLGIAYLLLIVLFFGESEGGFGSLEDVAKLFVNPWALLAGWIHYLAFDLFVGIWEVKDAEERGISHWFVAPCLFFTFMFGPIGMLLYMIVRTVAKKKVILEI